VNFKETQSRRQTRRVEVAKNSLKSRRQWPKQESLANAKVTALRV